jgi:hypothetical protein
VADPGGVDWVASHTPFCTAEYFLIIFVTTNEINFVTSFIKCVWLWSVFHLENSA